MVRLLQLIEEATREVSGDYSLAGVIVPIVNSLEQALTTNAESTVDDHGITHMKQQILSSLKQRYQNMETNQFFALAAVLDPRFKLCVFTSASASTLVWQMLMEEYEQLAETDASPVTAEQSPRTVNETSENDLHVTSMLWNYFDELVKEQNSDGPASTPAV